MPRMQNRATGFCIDVPNPADRPNIAVQNFHCGDDNLAQLFIVDQL